ncbi:hypothetical protein [Streptomyces sp. NPDC126499]|uniref:hypothetical protein n=1 Tax=Streptomyces sp. NPDC126499 TaxID=3155314 RepID=UPI00332BC37C
MYLVEFLLAKPPTAPEASESATLSALRSASLPGDGVEHIRLHMSRAGARGVFFCLAPDPVHAMARVDAVCRRALETCPALRGWQTVRIARAADVHGAV